MSYSAKEKKREMEDLLLPGEIWEGTVRSRAGREGGRAGRWQRRMLYNETPPTAPPPPTGGNPAQRGSFMSEWTRYRTRAVSGSGTQVAKKTHPTWISTLRSSRNLGFKAPCTMEFGH